MPKSDRLLGQVTRTISVKQGTALFFPLINSEVDNVCGLPHLGGNCFDLSRFPAPLSVPDMQAFETAQMDTVTGLLTTVTPTDRKFRRAVGPAVSVDIARLQSPAFSYTLPPTDNLYQSFGISVVGTVAPAVAEGYWSFIPGTGANSLAPGYYVLRFGGSQPINEQGNTFTEAIAYQITVTP